jgi:predicted Zn-dependent protease
MRCFLCVAAHARGNHIKSIHCKITAMRYVTGAMKKCVRSIFLFVFGAVLVVAGFLAPVAHAQMPKDQIIIRDTEIENALKGWLAPLAAAAGMDPDNIRLILVQSPQVNAFVAGGSNMFLYTGLIDKTENPLEIIGVMAHELGHIAGSHLIISRSAMDRASYESILGTVLGVGAAIVTGDGNAAMAGLGLGSSVARSNLLTFSRVQESAADQAALRFLEAAKINPTGLVSFFEKLESEELLPASQQSAYMRTHPLTRDRLDLVAMKVKNMPLSTKDIPKEWTDQHARIKAKLIGFVSPGRVPWAYEDSDGSIPAKYARAIAAYRESRVEDALKIMDDLIAQEPQNPYFQELKGQMLMDFGRVAAAVPYYRRASEQLPDSGLIRIAYARALMESGQGDSGLKQAVVQLERAIINETRSPSARRMLATAYGRMGQETMAKVELAEEALLQRRLDNAESLAEGVLKSSPKDSREAVRAHDILNQIAVLKRRAE